jgi:hypothetical protein
MLKNTWPHRHWTLLTTLCLGMAIVAFLPTPHYAQGAGRNSTPKILGLTATPPYVGSDGNSCLVTFRLDDPDGDYISWSIDAQATGNDDLDESGSLSPSSGTDAPGSLVQVTYNAPQTWNNITVVLKVTATDGRGGWAAAQWISIPVAPGGLGRGM